mmetsp:Transcript_90710/g.228115  ORF Transcript_90710/g.228115 Transcript_90710/m.228115 type:complete len:387 (+) Transcript_90710:72-1232(+)
MEPLAALRATSRALGESLARAWPLRRCARRSRWRRPWWFGAWATDCEDFHDVEWALGEPWLPLSASEDMECMAHSWEIRAVVIAQMETGTPRHDIESGEVASGTIALNSGRRTSVEANPSPVSGELTKVAVESSLATSPRQGSDYGYICGDESRGMPTTPTKPGFAPAAPVESSPEQPSSSTQEVSPLLLSPGSCSEEMSPSSSPVKRCGTRSALQALFLSVDDDEPALGAEVSEEVKALSRRVSSHQVVWPSQVRLDLEDHLCRAPDVATFKFLDRRDRVFQALAEVSPAPALGLPAHQQGVDEASGEEAVDPFGGEFERSAQGACTEGLCMGSSRLSGIAAGHALDLCIYEEPPDWPRWKVASFAHREAVRYDRRRRRTAEAGG